MQRYSSILLACALLILSLGCAQGTPTAVSPKTELVVSLLYPTAKTKIEMGQPLRTIVKVLDGQGQAVTDAQVNLSFIDSGGNQAASVPATVGSGDLYRTTAWTVPHKMQAGLWTVVVEARNAAGEGSVSATFQVKDSISEMLLNKYGFWVESPALRGIDPALVKEQGDAQNGMIIWGGVIPTQHIFPESWLEIHWRQGNFNLETAEDVRKFMLSELGDLGFTLVRELGPFQQVRFKDWDAWQVKVRGEFLRYDDQWVVFYAPEVDKTYAIGTTVVLPPSGVDAHALLQGSFEVHPEIHSNGAAPVPLSRLLPPPELIGPELGAHFTGTDQTIILKWKPVKDLAEDEYYLVRVDYNYAETNQAVQYTTRETHFTLPVSLYHLPNCSVFNWRITLMQQTGVKDGELEGRPLSFGSLYWYVQWFYPLDAPAPFPALCPNPQY